MEIKRTPKDRGFGYKKAYEYEDMHESVNEGKKRLLIKSQRQNITINLRTNGTINTKRN